MKPDPRRTLVWQTIAWTVILELITVVLRFGFALQSTRDTAATIGRLTFGLRIHHSYIGIALLPLAMWLERRSPKWSTVILALGLGLFFSDMIHHFVVLWIVTGSPQFDLLY